ncbi:hypothetical protein SAMN05443247_05026 [Bradyrhizobium erythrophlei]|nr:hypothetical protein SAMN05443247_05026 [Bradyrhizobium erythrophlei]
MPKTEPSRSDEYRFENAMHEVAEAALRIFRHHGYSTPDISDDAAFIAKISEALEPTMQDVFPEPDSSLGPKP